MALGKLLLLPAIPFPILQNEDNTDQPHTGTEILGHSDSWTKGARQKHSIVIVTTSLQSRDF